MTTKNIKSLTGEITEGIKKGQIAVGKVVRISQGVATDFMTDEQYTRRQCRADDLFVEIEIVVEGSCVTRTMKDYTRINSGTVPQNSALGKLLAVYEIAEDSDINMVAKEFTDREGGKFCLWEIVV